MRAQSAEFLRLADLAHARWLHGSRRSIDDSEARASAPGRGGTRRIAFRRGQWIIPVVRGPDVAGRVDRHVGEHLDAAALENVDNIAGLGASRVPLRVYAGQQNDATTARRKVADPYVVIAVNVQAPRYIDRAAAGVALRRGLGAVGTDHIDHAGGFRVLQHGSAEDLELLHDGRTVGNLRYWEVQGHVARHPNIVLRVERKGADADPGSE